MRVVASPVHGNDGATTREPEAVCEARSDDHLAAPIDEADPAAGVRRRFAHRGESFMERTSLCEARRNDPVAAAIHEAPLAVLPGGAQALAEAGNPGSRLVAAGQFLEARLDDQAAGVIDEAPALAHANGSQAAIEPAGLVIWTRDDRPAGGIDEAPLAAARYGRQALGERSGLVELRLDDAAPTAVQESPGGAFLHGHQALGGRQGVRVLRSDDPLTLLVNEAVQEVRAEVATGRARCRGQDGHQRRPPLLAGSHHGPLRAAIAIRTCIGGGAAPRGAAPQQLTPCKPRRRPAR